MKFHIFSIESSCDETSVAIITDQKKILSHITVNQENHNKFGGVVPEIASRAHLQILQSIIPRCFKEANKSIKDIDLFCATSGPGLIGGLLVGTTIAKSMALGMRKPFYPINHLEGHLLSPQLTQTISFPNLTLLLTGGHTQIYLVESVGKYELLGETVDDAIGESFDKVAKILNLGYPGGPAIEKIAKNGNPFAYELPHPLESKKNLKFSFSGIKTAVNNLVKKQNKINQKIRRDIAASFQQKITEILTKKIMLSLDELKKRNYNVKNIALVGGVAANQNIKKNINKLCINNKFKLILPEISYCGDNAAMIAWTCYQRYKNNIKPDLGFKAKPKLPINENINETLVN